MAKRITALSRQSPLDIAVQTAGTIEMAFELATANGIGITDYLTAGQEMSVPDYTAPNSDVLNYYTVRGLKPATANDSRYPVIGHFIIGQDLID